MDFSPFPPESIVDLLTKYNHSFELINPGSEQQEMPAIWLENNFPITSYGRIDWQFVDDSICLKWNNDNEIRSLFGKFLKSKKLNQKVIVMWANALRIPLMIEINSVLQFSTQLVDEDFDVWIFDPQSSWCLEAYNTREVCFGVSPTK